jgi:hypothetical protein
LTFHTLSKSMLSKVPFFGSQFVEYVSILKSATNSHSNITRNFDEGIIISKSTLIEKVLPM